MFLKIKTRKNNSRVVYGTKMLLFRWGENNLWYVLCFQCGHFSNFSDLFSKITVLSFVDDFGTFSTFLSRLMNLMFSDNLGDLKEDELRVGGFGRVVAVLRLINRVRSLLIHDIQERKTNSFRKNSIGTHSLPFNPTRKLYEDPSKFWRSRTADTLNALGITDRYVPLFFCNKNFWLFDFGYQKAT